MSRSSKKVRFFGAVAVTGMAALAAACGNREPEEAAEVPVEEAAPTPGPMEGMPAMGAPGMGSAAMEPMQVHLERMASIPIDSLEGMRDTHRQMVANMLAKMNREMSAMGMSADATWTTTVDSLRADLTGMLAMNAAEMRAFMPAHAERVTRLMSMHAAMMRGM